MENLETQVKQLIHEIDTTHRYSMSRIYGLYNEVFGKEEKPQSCASCLIRKTNELKKWFNEQSLNKQIPEQQPEAKKETKKARTKKK